MFSKLKEECCKANLELPQLGLVIYNFGNVSCIDRTARVFAIKPSGIDYACLRPENIVIVDLDGKVVEGAMRPSSDTNTHLELYKAFPNIGGVVHTHSVYTVAWAQAHRDVPLYGTTHADHLAENIPCTEFMSDECIKNDYETETGLQIIKRFMTGGINPDEVPMVLVAGHGAFTWGDSAAKAVYNAKIMEELCRMAQLTEAINPAVRRLKQSLINKHYTRKHGKDAYYGQD